MSQSSPQPQVHGRIVTMWLSLLALLALIVAPIGWILALIRGVVYDGQDAACKGKFSFLQWLVLFCWDAFLYWLSVAFLFFVPLPFFGPLSRAYTGGHTRGFSRYGFAGFDRLVLVGHIVWVGWVVHLMGLANGSIHSLTGFQVTEQMLAWLWIIVIIGSIVLMIYDFPWPRIGIVALLVLMGGLVLAVDALLKTYVFVSEPIVVRAIRMAREIDMVISWGFPMVLSVALGSLFVVMLNFYNLARYVHFQRASNMFEFHDFFTQDRSMEKHTVPPQVEIFCWLKFILFGIARMRFGTTLVLEVVPRPFRHKAQMNVWMATHDVNVVREDGCRTSQSVEVPTAQNPVAAT